MRVSITVFLTSLIACTAFGQSYTISTFAGGAHWCNIPATSKPQLGAPQSRRRRFIWQSLFLGSKFRSPTGRLDRSVDPGRWQRDDRL